MGRDIHIEVPVLRMELAGIKYQVMTMLETRHGEMQAAIETGITLAYQQLPPMVAERVRAGILNAAAEATCAAMKEYFGPGGRGYQRIMADIVEQIEGKEVGARVKKATYVIAGPEPDFGPRDRFFAYDDLEKALEQTGNERDAFIWKVEEGKPWMKMYRWDKNKSPVSVEDLGVWVIVPREQR